MKKEVYLTILYDYYESLIKEEDKKYFKDYYFDNLSLSEISENYNISRAGVHKKLKKIEELLYDYESKLKLLSKEEKILTLLKEESLKEKIKNILNS